MENKVVCVKVSPKRVHALVKKIEKCEFNKELYRYITRDRIHRIFKVFLLC